MIAFPKPKSRKSERGKVKAHERRWIKTIREQVVFRDGNRCRACAVSPVATSNPVFLHMHEIIYRSKTRGRPIEERVNTYISILLCDRCHMDIHNHKLSLEVIDSKLGANGRIKFREIE
jgi:hypothetical protein